jgi:threonine dehydrogenase-like Zn-dependent dehydrogenase
MAQLAPAPPNTTTSRAAVLRGVNGPFEIRDVPVPELRPHGVLLQVALSGVCATDAHVFNGDWPGFRFPSVLGHENCARIAALGPGVETDFVGQSLAVGDLIVPRVAGCGRCWYCLVGGASRWCPNRSAGSATADSVALSGGWSEFMYLEGDSVQLFKTSAPAEVAVLTEPMATCVGGIDRAAIKLGETVVVQGAGPIGLLTTACARLAGAGTLIVVGGPSQRLELARTFGADLTIDIDAQPDPAERTRQVLAATPRGFGADLVLGCVGHPAAVGEGLGYLRPGNARMVEIGNATGGGSFPMRPSPDLVYKNSTLHGFWGTTPAHWIGALRVLERRALPFERVVSHRLPLSRVYNAIAAINGGAYNIDGRTALKVAIEPGLR